MTHVTFEQEPSMGRLWLWLGHVAEFLPFYGYCVDREARRLIVSCGANAERYALREADEALSPAWSRFMGRVAGRVRRLRA